MVATRNAGPFAEVLESLYTGLESLPTTGYQGDASDGWSQATGMALGQINAHLEALVELGGVPQVATGHYVLDGMLHFAHRYVADDDSVSQARRVAATMHAIEYLLDWSNAEGARIYDCSAQVDNSRPDWSVVSISFSLILPRR